MKDALKRAIELRERLEADIVSDFADPPIGIQQLSPRVLQTYLADAFASGQGGDALQGQRDDLTDRHPAAAGLLHRRQVPADRRRGRRWARGTV